MSIYGPFHIRVYFVVSIVFKTATQKVPNTIYYFHPFKDSNLLDNVQLDHTGSDKFGHKDIAKIYAICGDKCTFERKGKCEI